MEYEHLKLNQILYRWHITCSIRITTSTKFFEARKAIEKARDIQGKKGGVLRGKYKESKGEICKIFKGGK